MVDLSIVFVCLPEGMENHHFSCVMGKATISMGNFFNSYVRSPEGILGKTSEEMGRTLRTPYKTMKYIVKLCEKHQRYG